MRLLRLLFGCLCCVRILARRSHYSHASNKSENPMISEDHSSSKVQHIVSVDEHYSYVDGVYIFDKSKMRVIKTEQSSWPSTQEEPVLPTEEKANVVRKRLSSM